MPHQKNPSRIIEAERTYTEGGTACEQKNEMKQADKDTRVERTGLPLGSLVIHPGFSLPAGFYWTCRIS